ncbi:M56 family metallopeptidase [Spirosoma validum]|uniref:M48 family metalloprotease n=1 Tax=Spirosoma validum TaxID=2771355 RepID=A0A927GEL3_9BACT|nr:M56 family metallopeptidase [Spirosoma validum]MBD2754735.1 M48 family metalloprotease [Spirosoma validum]
MNAFNFLSNPIADALGWTLLHAIWQGFALVLPTAFILHLLRNQSSTLRYHVSVFTLLTQVLLSAATFIWYYRPTENSPLYVPTTLSASYATHIKWQTVAQTLPWHQQVQQFLEAHLSQFVLVYLLGVALFGLRLAGGWIYLQRLSQTATSPATVLWTHMTDKLRSSLLIQTPVQVRESARISVPMVVGVLKPILLLPIGLITHLTTREIEAVLAHELAHIKRHDYAVNLLQSVVEVLYFFHPALWWLSARVREEREHCCDDLAVQVCGGDGRILAQALARVEELRLTQISQTPALAMAFASKRQQLLHRVRRMLGVPTRPFVSNSSLAGITLATLLLMSVSVYAVQQEKPTSGTRQPRPSHSTRRHSKGNGTEYSMIDNKKVDYVIWKGQKLSTKRVARLQRQLDQVMAGKLSLDNVAKSDRDILLTIIETNQSFDGGMNALSEGLSHIDYNNIVTSALNNVPLSPDGTIEGLAKVDYNSIIHDALASVPQSLNPLSDSLDKQRAYHQHQLDSLSQLVNQQSKQVQNLHRQMENLRFPVEEVERSQQVLEWRKEKLAEQRNALIEKHQRLLNNEGKQKLTQADIEKQLTAIEPEIKKQEISIDELNKELEATQSKLQAAQQPLEKLEREAEQLNERIEKLSNQMDQHGNHLSYVMPDLSDLNVNAMATTRLNRLNRVINAPRPPRPPKAAISIPASPRAPRVSVPSPAAASIPSAVAAPARVSNARTLPPAPPASAAKPRALPKPALAPKPEKLE